MRGFAGVFRCIRTDWIRINAQHPIKISYNMPADFFQASSVRPAAKKGEFRDMEMLYHMGRFLAVVVGVVLIVVGIYHAIGLFSQIYDGLTQPAGLQAVIDDWALLIASDLGEYPHNETLNKAEHLRILALMVLGIGGTMLIWLTLVMIVAGSRILHVAAAAIGKGPTPEGAAIPAARASAAQERKPRQEPAYTPIPPRKSGSPVERELGDA